MRARITLFYIIATVLFLLGVVSFSTPLSTSAQTEADALRNKIEQASNRIAQIEEEIRRIGSDIAVTSQQRLTLENELKRIEQERQHLLTELSLTSTKIEKTNFTIENLSGEISEKEQKILNQKRGIAKSIQRIHEQDQYTVFELLIAKDDMSDFWSEVDSLLTLQKASRQQIRRLKGLQEDLRTDIEIQSEQKQELESLKKDIEDQKKLVEYNKKQQENLVTETKSKEEIYKQQLATKEAQRKAFEDEVRAYESQLKFLANPSALPPAGSSPLSWPLDSIVVTQLFGAKTGPHRTYANGHSGVDFRARTPVKVYAMADGVVMGTGDTDLACKGVSFGRWIAIKYDNNLVSTYGHLSIMSVKEGQRVTRGQVVGYTGNTGRSTAPHLHVSLYAGVDANGNNPVDVSAKPSISCKGAILKQPTAPTSAYLDMLDYISPLTIEQFKSAGDYYSYQ